MAGAHCANSFRLPLPAFSSIPRKPLVLSAISTPFPSKITKRKNYLRPKLLKILTKPYPNPLPQSPSTNPIIPIEYVLPEIHEFRDSEIVESPGVMDGSVGKFDKIFVLKFGSWLVAAFVFQTICAVLFLNSASSGHKNENFGDQDKDRVFELGMNGNSQGKLGLFSDKKVNGKIRFEQGGMIHLDDSELEKKIEEIRGMAREAREREKLELKRNDFDDSDDDDVIVRSGIEKEVDDRLVKLKKMRQKTRERMAVASVNYMGNDHKVGDRVNVGAVYAKEDGALMFKKKYKFKSPSLEVCDKPKGFMMNDRSANVGDDGESALKKEENKSSRGGRNIGREMGVVKAEHRSVVLQENNADGPQVEAVKSGGSSEVDPQNPQIFRKESPKRTPTSNKHNVFGKNSSLNSKIVGKKQSASKVGDKKTDADLWWSSLPYVLTILMRRGHDGEGAKGLFTLKSISHTEGDSSRTVAFEDRGDATNFCYILQSFFEDLDDFSAEIVPLPIKELDEAVKANDMKVLVVKKGQLKLYAGQPLSEVEMSLRSLVPQN